jgi:membrane protein DedA with SNARE-associated domain
MIEMSAVTPAFIMARFPHVGLFLLLVLGGVGFPFPEDATLILCGFLIGAGVAEPVPALVSVYLGLLLTDSMLYYFGRKYGRKIIKKKMFHRILSPERLEMIEEKYHKWGILVMLIGRQLVGLRAQVFLVSGIVRLPFSKFLISDVVSAVISISVMTTLGYIGGHSLELVKRDLSRIGHFVIIAAVLAFIVFLVLKYIGFHIERRRRRKP